MNPVEIFRGQTNKTMSIRNLSATALFIIMAVLGNSCRQTECCGHFTEAEQMLIQEADSIMRVLTVEDEKDLTLLRSKCRNLSDDALRSDDYARLAELMVATVTHPSQDGVGIAGPQVGLNRRVVAVQRFDKPDYPFEVYPNIHIVWQSDEKELGSEGCLSVPGRDGEVLRSTEIIIEYADLSNCGECRCEKCEHGTIPMVRETVSGFTAVIFQHEVDHLEGVLYIDRL